MHGSHFTCVGHLSSIIDVYSFRAVLLEMPKGCCLSTKTKLNGLRIPFVIMKISSYYGLLYRRSILGGRSTQTSTTYSQMSDLLNYIEWAFLTLCLEEDSDLTIFITRFWFSHVYHFTTKTFWSDHCISWI